MYMCVCVGALPRRQKNTQLSKFLCPSGDSDPKLDSHGQPWVAHLGIGQRCGAHELIPPVY